MGGLAKGHITTNAVTIAPLGAGQLMVHMRDVALFSQQNITEQNLESKAGMDIGFDDPSQSADTGQFLDTKRTKMLSLPRVYARNPDPAVAE